MVYAASIRAEIDSFAEVLIFSLMFYQALFKSSPSFKFSEAANLFVISICHCFLTSSSFSFIRSNLSTSNFGVACFTYCPSVPNFRNHQTVKYNSQLPWNFAYIVYSNAISYLSICDQSGCESSHQKRSRCTYECFGAGTSCS